MQRDPLVTVKNQRTHLNAFFTFILIMKGRSPFPSGSPVSPAVPVSLRALGQSQGWGRAAGGAQLPWGGCLGVPALLPFIPRAPPFRQSQSGNFIYSVC